MAEQIIRLKDTGPKIWTKTSVGDSVQLDYNKSIEFDSQPAFNFVAKLRVWIGRHAKICRVSVSAKAEDVRQNAEVTPQIEFALPTGETFRASQPEEEAYDFNLIENIRMPAGNTVDDIVRALKATAVVKAYIKKIDPPITALLDVNVTHLVRQLDASAELNDGTTSLKIVVASYGDNIMVTVVPPDFFREAEPTPCVLNADETVTIGGEVFPALGSDNFMADSRARMKTVAERYAANVPEWLILDHRLVSIDGRPGSSTWVGAGVFYFGDKSVHATYLKSVRAAGVHPMGRVALMHRTLLALVGVNKSTPKPLFTLEDAWRGAASVGRDDVVAALRDAVDFTLLPVKEDPIAAELKSIMLEGVDAVLSEDRYRIEIMSFELTKGHILTQHIQKAFSVLFDALRHNATTANDFLHKHKHKHKLNLEITIAKFSDVVSKRAIALYNDRLRDQMNASAVIVGPVPEGAEVEGTRIKKVDVSHGIYGVYTKAEAYAEGARVKEFHALPWAVATGFTDLC